MDFLGILSQAVILSVLTKLNTVVIYYLTYLLAVHSSVIWGEEKSTLDKSPPKATDIARKHVRPFFLSSFILNHTSALALRKDSFCCLIYNF